jgi:hypothetical protein
VREGSTTPLARCHNVPLRVVDTCEGGEGKSSEPVQEDYDEQDRNHEQDEREGLT